MEKKILLLGSGLVVDPLVKYFLQIPDFHLTIATLELDKALGMLGGHPRGKAVFLDAAVDGDLEALVKEHDIAISLLPAPMHPRIGLFCLKYKKNLVTASYVSPAMRGMDRDARTAGVIFLNELGLDPGIDHMSAMRIIHHVSRTGGKVTGFRSYCGGLPAPEANTNLLGYKFSWAPRGVLVAATNSARYLWDGVLKEVPGERLFQSYEKLTVEGMDFEAYPNRDSMPYMDIYGLQGVRTMFRGTLRYPGWCHILQAIVRAGYLNQNENVSEASTYSQMSRELGGGKKTEVERLIADRAGVSQDDPAMDALRWLGMFDQTPLDGSLPSILDHFARRCMEKMQYTPGERDMVVLHHVFTAEIQGSSRTITSSLIDFGIPGGHSAMARTVSLPVAIGARMILEGRIHSTGVQIPVSEDIYQPVLKELENLNIRCVEHGL